MDLGGRPRRTAGNPYVFLAVASFVLAIQRRDDARDFCYDHLMPLWDAKLPCWNGGNFNAVTPLEVLAELDEPLTFTFMDSNGSLMLAHLCSEGMDRLRYVVAPTSLPIVHELKTGVRSIRQALDQPIVWLLDVGVNAAVLEAWVTTLGGLPDNVVPVADVMLYSWFGPTEGRLARRVS